MLFTSPIVAQYGYALGLCAASVIPFATARAYAAVILAAGGAAAAQMIWLVRNLLRRHAEQTVTKRYWMWSAVMPCVAALLLLATGAWMLLDGEVHVGGVAAAVLVLALTGVRNSWLLVSWFFDERERHAQSQASE